MLGLETNFERATPIPHQLQTKTASISSRLRPRPQEIGHETETGFVYYAMPVFLFACQYIRIFAYNAIPVLKGCRSEQCTQKLNLAEISTYSTSTTNQIGYFLLLEILQ